jgi:hypothetical protein
MGKQFTCQRLRGQMPGFTRTGACGRGPQKVQTGQTINGNFRHPIPKAPARDVYRSSGLDSGWAGLRGERDRPGRRWQRPIANIFHSERSAGRRPPRAGRTRPPFHPQRSGVPTKRKNPKPWRPPNLVEVPKCGAQADASWQLKSAVGIISGKGHGTRLISPPHPNRHRWSRRKHPRPDAFSNSPVESAVPKDC